MTNVLSQDTRSVKVWTKWINLWAMSLILSGLLVNAQGKKMDEAPCSPRPVTVAVTDARGNEVLPYHVVLHRCSGTCHNTSPRIKACKVKDYDEIDLEVMGGNKQKTTVAVKNHTSCHCICNCKPNESILDRETCRCGCIGNCDTSGPVSAGTRKNDKPNQPTPYLIAIIAVGTFAIIVLLFDATMYFKKQNGFFYSIKNDLCCKPEQDKQGSNQRRSCMRKNPCQHTVV